MPQPSSDFSFDLYPGLDRELNEVYQRNVEQGVASGEAIAQTALSGAVDRTLEQWRPDTLLSPEIRDWASEELEPALSTWRDTYGVALEQAVPGSFEELLQESNKTDRLKQLYEARQALVASNETTPEGLNAGETMHLVAIPWKTMLENLDNFPNWVQERRNDQGVATTEEFFASELATALRDDTKLYRNPLAGRYFSTTTQPQPEWLSAREYLRQMIVLDGDWGVMLTQTCDDAGLDRLVQGGADARTPNALTNNGTSDFVVAGQNVGQMGIFEWIALTLQEDPSTLSSRDVSWFLANRFELNGEPRVPNGYWNGGQVYSSLYWASFVNDNMRPRLAVIQT